MYCLAVIQERCNQAATILSHAFKQRFQKFMWNCEIWVSVKNRPALYNKYSKITSLITWCYTSKTDWKKTRGSRICHSIANFSPKIYFSALFSSSTGKPPGGKQSYFTHFTALIGFRSRSGARFVSSVDNTAWKSKNEPRGLPSLWISQAMAV